MKLPFIIMNNKDKRISILEYRYALFYICGEQWLKSRKNFVKKRENTRKKGEPCI